MANLAVWLGTQAGLQYGCQCGRDGWVPVVPVAQIQWYQGPAPIGRCPRWLSGAPV